MKIPDGWKKQNIGNLFDVQLGKMLNEKAKKGIQYPYLANFNVRWGNFDLSKTNKMFFSEKEREKYFLQKGDLLMCEGGEIGRCAVWLGTHKGIFYQKALHRLRPTSEECTTEYLYVYMQFVASRGLLVRFVGESSIAHLTVEGDSDELVFQKAYMDVNEGKLPIEDGIDVISVGLTFKRFLTIAKNIEQPVGVITDNDGDYENNITKKYKEFIGIKCISIFADNNNDLRTLEPQFVEANKNNLSKLCNIIQIDSTSCNTEYKICEYMIKNKTHWALNVFDSEIELVYPKYITDAVSWCNE